MKAWQIRGEYGIDKLQCVELPEPAADKEKVVVSMRAARRRARTHRKTELKPMIDRTFTFDEVPAARRTLESGRFFGALCVRFDV